jgi:hypothetical protein
VRSRNRASARIAVATETSTVSRAGSPKRTIPKIVTGPRAISMFAMSRPLCTADAMCGLEERSMPGAARDAEAGAVFVIVDSFSAI